MPSLNLLPWCRLEKGYRVGELTLQPYSAGEQLPGLDDTVLAEHVKSIVQGYRGIEGKAFGRSAVAFLSDGPALKDLSADEEESLSELITVACFSSLANRDLASAGGHYSNSTRFALYRHRFERAGDFTSLVYRRRDGRIRDGRYLPELRFTAPLETSSLTNVVLDEPLGRDLAAYRSSASERDWGRLFNALTWFNFANSDSETVSEQMEWVALASALQELMNCQSNAADFAKELSARLQPREVLVSSNSRRNKGMWKEPERSLLHQWAYEFYSVRGQFAHGRITARGQDGWTRTEHLTLASMAFPLLVRQHISQGAALGSRHKAESRGFEQLLDCDFLRPPDPHSEDQRYPWDKIVARETLALASEAAFEKLSAAQPEVSPLERSTPPLPLSEPPEEGQ